MLPYFWGMMSLATMVTFLVAYPINARIMNKGIKHGMMYHELVTLPRGQMLFYVIEIYLIFFAVMWIISLPAPLRFS